jgi:hypothetical protein
MLFRGGQVSLGAVLHLALFYLALLYPLSVMAAGSQDIPSPSNYSGVGLLDMRTARFFPDGYLVLSTSFTQPDDRYAITFQALPWAELTFRYSITRAISDSGVPLHDRSFDAKFRLSHETEYLPELALGFQDILGTGVYSGEYFVGSKRWGSFDFTLGLGWGRLGSRGTFENPFGILSSSFLTRNTDFGFGGAPLLKSYFRGPDVGLFGGIEYNAPIENLTLKIEYSSDAYLEEKRQSGKDFGFPLNFGVSYRPYQWLDVGLSLMHGKYPGVRISTLIDAPAEIWQGRLDPPPRFRARSEERAGTILQPEAPASSGGAPETHSVDLTMQRDATSGAAGPIPPSPAEPTPASTLTLPALPDVLVPNVGATVAQDALRGAPLEADISARIEKGLDDQKLAFFGASVEGDKIIVLIENARYRRDTEALARAARVLSAVAPQEIEYFEITLLRAGQPLTTITLPRTEIDKLARRDGSPAELFKASEISTGALTPLDHLRPDLFPQLGGSVFPVFRQSLFDPDNPFYVRFGVGATEDLRLARGWFVDGTLVASLYDDFNQIRRGPNSALPHVRSDIANYLKKGKFGLENVSTSYFFKLAPEIYGRASAGYLEEMFAGVGGELLYRPFGQRWAIGADLWEVQQRDYHVQFDLRHYQTLTGHLTAYYEMPWHDVRVAVSAGRYLAGDKGVTFALSRRFSTGVEVGAWFTLTNVSAAQFGEGSFDKGIRIVIPFEWVAPFATRSGYELSLRPIQRDGGQRLVGDTILYDVTEPSNYGTLIQEWNSVFK